MGRRLEIFSNTLVFPTLRKQLTGLIFKFHWYGLVFFQIWELAWVIFFEIDQTSRTLYFRFKKFQTPYFLARKFHYSKWFHRFSYPLNSPLEILLINYLGQLHTQSPLHFFLKADYLGIFHAVWFLYPWESDHFMILTL